MALIPLYERGERVAVGYVRDAGCKVVNAA